MTPARVAARDSKFGGGDKPVPAASENAANAAPDSTAACGYGSTIGVSFTVLGAAQPAGSKRAFVNAKTKRVVVTDDAKRSRPWKQEVASCARDAMGARDLYAGALLLELDVTVQRPRGHYGRHGILPSAPVYPTVRPDLLKLARAVEDALTGIVYRDDALIVVEHLRKSYGEPARIEVAIAPLDELAPNGL